MESPDNAQQILRLEWEEWGLTSVRAHSGHVDFSTCDFPFSTSVGRYASPDQVNLGKEYREAWN